METKYMNQLTLAVIESESLIPATGLGSKPSTAENNNRLAATLEAPDEEYETITNKSATAEREHEPKNEDDFIKSTAESAKNDWRQYFTIEELTTAFEKIQRGEDPNEDETVSDADNGSDSCPSEDNVDLKDLYGVIYGERAKRTE